MMYEIAVSKTFCAAHAIRLEDGSAEPMHGHNWDVEAVVGADQLDSIETVMDFDELKRWLDAAVADAENRCLNQIPPFVDQNISPTAERVAQWIAEQIAKRIPPSRSLIRVTVTEAPGCKATFRPQYSPGLGAMEKPRPAGF